MRFLTLFTFMAEDVSAFMIKAFLFVILAALVRLDKSRCYCLCVAEGPNPTALAPGCERHSESWGLEGGTGKMREN